MEKWSITVLDYGRITFPKTAMTPGYDPNLIITVPYLGFLLRRPGHTVLVDTGIAESFIVNGRAWGGHQATGGKSYVLKALTQAGVAPEEIQMVLYTHLHNDHAGACDLFPNAMNVFQKDEYLNLLNPLPSQQIRKDYDTSLIAQLSAANNCIIDGDVRLENGIELYKTPGHTSGSMSVLAHTDDGPRIMVGDFAHLPCMMFPQQEKMTMLDGSVEDITPAPVENGPVMIGALVYDHYAYYDSFYKLKSLVPKYEPKYFLGGHDPALLYHGV